MNGRPLSDYLAILRAMLMGSITLSPLSAAVALRISVQ